MKKNIGIIIQARLGSKRFPKKILSKIDKKIILEILIKRLKKINFTNKVIIATTTNKIDEKIIKIAKKNNIDYFCGSENDVLDRYYCCAKKFNLTDIVRITSDCPFSDPLLIEKMYKKYSVSNFDYLSNVIIPTFPDGLDVEFFNFKTLKKTWKLAKNLYEREHVTYHMINNYNIKKFNYENTYDLSMERITLDTLEDLERIKSFYFSFKDLDEINYNSINNKFLNMKKKINLQLIIIFYGTKPKKTYLMETCFYLKIQKLYFQLDGPHIFQKQRR